MSPRGVKGHPTRVRCHVTQPANGAERRRENRSTMPLRLDVKVSMNLLAVREAASLAQHTARSFGSRLIRCWWAQIRTPPASLYCSMAVGEIVLQLISQEQRLARRGQYASLPPPPLDLSPSHAAQTPGAVGPGEVYGPALEGAMDAGQPVQWQCPHLEPRVSGGQS